jgi:hypothetical protein
MVSEIDVIVGGAVGALASGLVGLAINWRDARRSRTRIVDSRKSLAWEGHHSDDLARNLLVLEMAGDKLESTPMDLAIRARLTPAELRKATTELSAAGLLEKPSSNSIRLTEDGRSVLSSHRLELEDSIHHRARSTRRSEQGPEDLDRAIESAVASLRAQHAHS